ncbi:hypothetical protein SADUNF_Sadunf06G0150500 [Salix dunnii]|uniref:Legume lectin domain-containing protein n=1 Tax=Salix dunnii TaxID=1413687 RepID=A0A835K7D3_9ROSI|nr:hypothetical protein SADUNF_Sadunf06G0150500 [Salix dunnii]
MRFPLAATAVILAVLLVLDQVQSLQFQFPNFSITDQSQLFLSDNSSIALGAIQVTPDVRGASMENRAGRVLYRQRFRLWRKKGKNANFNTNFVLNVKNETASSGEGLAFILTADPSVPDGSDGQWLGIVNSRLNGTTEAHTVAVEFDTRKSFPEDLDDNHIGLDVNSVYSKRSVSLNDRGIYISAAKDIKVFVQYDGKNLTVFVGDDMKNPVFSEPLDLSDYLPEVVHIGFSGSTSDHTQLNCVRSWEFIGSEIKDSKLLWVWILVAVGLVLILLIGIGIAFFLYRKRGYEGNRLDNGYPNVEEEILGFSTSPKKRGTILEGADPRLNAIFIKEEMECVLILGLACCHPNPKNRPSMKTVLQPTLPVFRTLREMNQIPKVSKQIVVSPSEYDANEKQLGGSIREDYGGKQPNQSKHNGGSAEESGEDDSMLVKVSYEVS